MSDRKIQRDAGLRLAVVGAVLGLVGACASFGGNTAPATTSPEAGADGGRSEVSEAGTDGVSAADASSDGSTCPAPTCGTAYALPFIATNAQISLAPSQATLLTTGCNAQTIRAQTSLDENTATDLDPFAYFSVNLAPATHFHLHQVIDGPGEMAHSSAAQYGCGLFLHTDTNQEIVQIHFDAANANKTQLFASTDDVNDGIDFGPVTASFSDAKPGTASHVYELDVTIGPGAGGQTNKAFATGTIDNGTPASVTISFDGNLTLTELRCGLLGGTLPDDGPAVSAEVTIHDILLESCP